MSPQYPIRPLVLLANLRSRALPAVDTSIEVDTGLAYRESKAALIPSKSWLLADVCGRLALKPESISYSGVGSIHLIPGQWQAGVDNLLATEQERVGLESDVAIV
jgi:hypothetical protein